MKGDKNRGDKLFDKLIYSVEFQKEVKNIRDQLGIPDAGFLNIKGVYSWYSKGENDLIELVSSLLKKQALPKSEWWQQKMIEYIIANGRFSFLPRTYPTGPFAETANRHISSVDLRIYEGTSQREVVDFIKKNWNKIKPAYRAGTAKIVQPERDPEIGRRIVEIWSKQRKELGPKDTAKEILIKRQIEKEFGKSPDFEAIKMRAYRKRHSKR